MLKLRAVARVLLGLFVIKHALGHTVLLFRGALEYPPSTVFAAVTVTAYTVALVALFAAGIGILGSRTFGKYVGCLIGAGVIASIVALTLGWNDSSWWGLSLDAVLVGMFAAARNVGVHPPRNTASTERHGVRRSNARIIGEAFACLLVGYVAVSAVTWPWHRHWGTTSVERRLELPGDPAARNVNVELMHAVTIDVPPDQVWPWLVQIGQDRAGFYSYDWLERLILADIHNVYEVRPEWQHRAAGDFVRAAPVNYLGGILGTDVGWTVSHVEPGRALVLDNWGAFVLVPDGPGRTRFFIRSSIGGSDVPVWGAALTFALFEIPHFIMERKMMLTIKECAERNASVAAVEARVRVN